MASLSLLCIPLVYRTAPFVLIAKSVAAPINPGFSRNNVRYSISGMPQRASSCIVLARFAHQSKRPIFRSANELYVGSSDAPLQPYMPPIRYPPILSWRGIVSRQEALMNIFKTFIATTQIKDALKATKEKWVKHDMVAMTAKLYTDINTAIAKGDIVQLRLLVTEAMLKKLDAQLGLSRLTGVPLSWSCNIKRPKLVSVRYARMPTESRSFEFAQITVRFVGTQSLASYDGREKHTSDINEYWVFERILKQKESKWRLCHQEAPK